MNYVPEAPGVLPRSRKEAVVAYPTEYSRSGTP